MKDFPCRSLDVGPYLVCDGEGFMVSTGRSDVTEQTQRYEGERASRDLKSILAPQWRLISMDYGLGRRENY